MAEPASDPVPAAAAQVESPAAFVARWCAELEKAERDKAREEWLKRCRRIIRRYRDKSIREDVGEGENSKHRFALFWSNIETLKPAVYARTPTAVVSRRFKDEDPVGRQASEVLERAINFSIDAYDFASIMEGARDAFLLLALGQAWVRYIPTFGTMPQAPPQAPTPAPADGASAPDAPPAPDPDGQIGDGAENIEIVEWEEVRAELLNYEDFGHSIARQWSEVRFVWRRAFMTRLELKKRFPDTGDRVPLDWSTSSTGGNAETKEEDADKAAIYEIWDLTSRQVIWISKGFKEGPLDRRDDPLGLDGFFPCPRPVLGTTAPDSIVPTPDYIYYQDQLSEIDTLTQRIDLMLDALKVRGFYASSEKDDLQNLFSAGANIMIPVDSWAAHVEAGGVKGLIEWFPVDMVATVLKGCFDARKQIIDDVYQVTGISDIQRGDTDPDETAAAQKIKANWGSSRVRDRQKALARFARDVIRIKGEVIASKFGAQTLAQMTGVKMLTAQEKAQAQQLLQAWQAAAQQAQAMQQPPPPNPVPQQVQQQLTQPTWDDVMALLQNHATRAYRIEIETDSTIEPNDQEEKQRRIEFVTAVGKFLAESLPVVQAAPQMLPVITESLKFLVRGFRVGREMEDVIDRCLDQLQAAAQNAPPGGQQRPGPNPQAEQAKAAAAQTNAQANVIKAQASAQGVQIEGQRVKLNHQAEMAGVAAEQQRTEVDAHLGNQDHMRQVIDNAEDRRARAEINDQRPITANTR